MKSGNAGSFNALLDPKTIEAVWKDHSWNCKQCCYVVPETPITTVHSCSVGAQFLKVLYETRRADELAAKKKAEQAGIKGARGKFYGSKKKVKSLMKFKGD